MSLSLSYWLSMVDNNFINKGMKGVIDIKKYDGYKMSNDIFWWEEVDII